jgi:ABC-type phosphate transport system substrate-binding protein
MSKRRTVVGAAVLGALLTGALYAPNAVQADPAGQPDDVVGVGSDIMQNSVNFLADGFGAAPGYNGAGNKNRLFSYDASGDANGRKAGTDPALGASIALNPSVILRAGTSPVQRPNGGGTGLAALIADGSNGTSANKISFARSPNLPTSAQQQTAQTNLGTALHSVQIGTDTDYVATATTTNAPDNLTTDDLVKIYTGVYTQWKQIPNYLDTHTATQGDQAIKPLIPQVGAGMRTIFLNGLKSANGGSAPNPTAGINVQQNDPTAITGLAAADKPNAIVPFPKARFDLLNAGYFVNPDTAYSAANPATPLSAAGVQLHTASGAWNTPFSYFVIFRESDYNSNTAWQPGGTLNWVQTLFFNPTGPKPYVDTAAGKSLLSSAGVNPTYLDFGNQTAG